MATPLLALNRHWGFLPAVLVAISVAMLFSLGVSLSAWRFKGDLFVTVSLAVLIAPNMRLRIGCLLLVVMARFRPQGLVGAYRFQNGSAEIFTTKTHPLRFSYRGNFLYPPSHAPFHHAHPEKHTAAYPPRIEGPGAAPQAVSQPRGHLLSGAGAHGRRRAPQPRSATASSIRRCPLAALEQPRRDVG